MIVILVFDVLDASIATHGMRSPSLLAGLPRFDRGMRSMVINKYCVFVKYI